MKISKNYNDKKIVLLVIRKSYEEIDWILPILKTIKNEYNIYTYFNSNESYESLKSFDFVFKEWSKVSKKFYVQKKSEGFFLRLLLFFIKKISFYNSWKIVNFINLKLNKIFYTEKSFCRMFGEKDTSKLRVIFNEAIWSSGWTDAFKKRNILTFRFPHATNIFSNFNKDKIYKKGNKFVKDCILLAGSRHDLPFLSKTWNLKNIKILGFPRYQKKWIEKNKKKKTNKNIIGVSLKNFQDEQKNNFSELILSILKVAKEFNNCKVIFKLHPRQNLKKFKNIIKKFKFINWEISKESVFSIASQAKVFLAYHRSSTILDGIAMGAPTIKLWSINVDDDNYISRFGLNKSIYTELGLAPVAHNYLDLRKFVKLAIENPNSVIWKKQKKKFIKICQNQDPLKSINTILSKNIRN